MAKRKIIEIDEAKCDGCGLCVPTCAEGALQIISGKARLVSDVYCDGLGACLGECPQGAIRMIEREAADFDEAAVQGRIDPGRQAAASQMPPPASTCPGIRPQSFSLPLAGPNNIPTGPRPTAAPLEPGASSALCHWPIQLRLISPGAPFLRGAALLLVADCAPVAMPDFQRLLDGHAIAVACPKLDNAQDHVARLAAIVAEANVKSITVVHMEVPCCTGLMAIAQAAVKAAGREIPLDDITVPIRLN